MTRFLWNALFTTTLWTAALPAADFFPLQPGNQWTYAMGEQRFTVQVGPAAQLGDRTYYVLSGYVDQTVMARYEAGQLFYWDADAGREVLLTSMLPGDSWRAPVRMCDLTGEARKGGEVHYRPGTCADVGLD